MANALSQEAFKTKGDSLIVNTTMLIYSRSV